MKALKKLWNELKRILSIFFWKPIYAGSNPTVPMEPVITKPMEPVATDSEGEGQESEYVKAEPTIEDVTINHLDRITNVRLSYILDCGTKQVVSMNYPAFYYTFVYGNTNKDSLYYGIEYGKVKKG